MTINVEARSPSPVVVSIPTGARGPAGPPGADGESGVGVPVGGSVGQVLAKESDEPFDTEWVTGFKWQSLTQAAYDALTPKDPNTLYVIVP